MEELKIVSVGELKEAKDGRKYFAITVQAGFGQKVRSRNIFESFKRDAQGNPTEEKIWDRGTREQALTLMKSNQPISGAIVTRKVGTYTLPSNEQSLSTYTTVVFPDENIVSVFASANHNIVDEESGELLGKKRVALATSEATKAAKFVTAE